MDFAPTEEQKRLLADVRETVLRERTPEVVEEIHWQYGWGPHSRAFFKKLAAKGYLTPAWPKQYGGLGRSHVDEILIADETSYQFVRPPMVAAGMAGPAIMEFGTEEQKQEWLPRISAGEIEFALGYTEPPAGSDLAALEIRAEDDGEYFVLNGMKTFNTACHYADYHWLAARTDPDKPKHKGVSLMIVDLKSPGITMRPLRTLAGWRTNEVYYDHVRVPKKNMVGERGRGLPMIFLALDHERILPTGLHRHLLEMLIEYVKEHAELAKDILIQRQLAELAANIEAGRLLNIRAAWLLDQKGSASTECSMVKIFVSECSANLSHIGMRILGPVGQLRRGSKWAPLDGLIEFQRRWSVIETIYAGTNEVLRNVIAQRGLGMPRG